MTMYDHVVYGFQSEFLAAFISLLLKMIEEEAYAQVFFKI